MTRRVHYKHGDTRPVQTTQVPDSHAHCLAAWCPMATANILDIVLTNEPLTLADVQVNEPFANSDHCTVCFSVFMDTCNKNLSQTDGMRNKCYSWKNINVDGMVAYLTRID